MVKLKQAMTFKTKSANCVRRVFHISKHTIQCTDQVTYYKENRDSYINRLNNEDIIGFKRSEQRLLSAVAL